jgi:hypothetical protein
MIALRPCPDHLSFALMAPHGCPDPFRVGNHQPSIEALSELASGRVAEGREGPNTTELESTANPVPPLKGSGHPGSRQTRPNHQPSIDALSELASGRVAEGREGPKTTQLESTANPFPTLKGSGHPGSGQTRPSHQPSIDALSELASGRVAEGREGPNTTHLQPKPNTPSLTGAPR